MTFGGPDLPITVVSVHKGGGVLATVEKQVLRGQHIGAPRRVLVQVGTQIVRVVAQEAGALGITQLRALRDSGGVELKTDAPIQQPLLLVSFGPPSPAARAVIEAARRATSGAE